MSAGRRAFRRLGLRGALAIALAILAGVAAPLVWRSPFARRQRAAMLAARGRAAWSAREDQRARESFRAALRLRPDDVATRRELGSLELANGNWELALLERESIAEFAPEDPEALVSVAALLLEKGWLEAPEAILDRALELRPERADARRMRAGIRFRLGRFFGAQRDAAAGADAALQAALETLQAGEAQAGPARAGPRWSRIDGRGGWIREEWPGRLAELRDQLEKALHDRSWSEAERLAAAGEKLAPLSAFGPFLHGVLELARGTAQAAERDFSAALTDAPRLRTVAGALGRAWAKQGGAAFAGDRLMQLAERDPPFAAARYLAARAFIEAGDPIKAEGALRRGLSLQPAAPVPYRQLTDYYFGLDRAAEALEICQQGVDRFPRDVGLRMMVAQIQAGMGRGREAIRAYEQLAAERPDLDIVQYKLATLLAQQGDARFAGIVRRLQADQPSDPLQADALGWLLWKAGDPGRARGLLESAVRDAPSEPGPHFHLASLAAGQGDRARARQELQLALESQQPFPERLEAIRLLRETSGQGR